MCVVEGEVFVFKIRLSIAAFNCYVQPLYKLLFLYEFK